MYFKTTSETKAMATHSIHFVIGNGSLVSMMYCFNVMKKMATLQSAFA